MEPCGARTCSDGYFTAGRVAARIADDRLDRPGAPRPSTGIGVSPSASSSDLTGHLWKPCVSAVCLMLIGRCLGDRFLLASGRHRTPLACAPAPVVTAVQLVDLGQPGIFAQQ